MYSADDHQQLFGGPTQLAPPGRFQAIGGARVARADAYVALGCAPSFTCAPYLLDSAPTSSEHVAWGESNAVVFANSVLGAKTQKYADYLDACAALTGRAPLAGAHIERDASLDIVCDFVEGENDFWPLLGYVVGLQAGSGFLCKIGGVPNTRRPQGVCRGLRHDQWSALVPRALDASYRFD